MTVSQKTLRLLAAETDNDDADVDVSGNRVDLGYEEYLVFPSHNDAERYAVNYVKEMLEDDPSMFNQDWLEYYMTMRAGDIQLFAQDLSNHVYDYDDDEALEYAGMDEDEDANEAREMLYGESVDDIARRLDDDPVGYFEEMGISAADAYKKGWLVIDEQKAAQDAVNTDGVAHFLASYDGNVIELDNGAEAYRIN